MERIKNYIEENKPYIRESIQMAWPAVLESFFVSLAGLIDSMMVSELGPYAVAAVGLTTQPKFIGMALFIATNVAVSAIVARRRGQQDRYGANQTLLVALLFVLTMGVIVSTICVAFADPIIRLCGSSPDTHESAVIYFQIIMGGMMFNIISLVINAAQRGAGRTKITMRTNLTANLLNMAGNYLLISGHLGFPALGIRGAALATVFGTMVACGMSIGSMFSRDGFISVFFMMKKRVRIRLEPLINMLRIGSTIFLEQLLLRVGFMATAVMAADMGTDAFAAHQVGMNINSLSFSFGDGMQVAAVALIGRSLGEERPDLAKLYGGICQRIGFCISFVLSVAYLLGGRFLFGLFFDEPHIIDMGVQIIHVIVVTVIFQISQVIYTGSLRGAGDVAYTTMTSTISVTFVRTICSYLFCYTFGFGLVGIWIGVMSDQLCRLVLNWHRFRSGKWTKIKV